MRDEDEKDVHKWWSDWEKVSTKLMRPQPEFHIWLDSQFFKLLPCISKYTFNEENNGTHMSTNFNQRKTSYDFQTVWKWYSANSFS